MPFWSYKSISDVGNAFRIAGEEKDFLRLLDVTVSESFRAEMKFILQKVYFNNSEFSVCENLILSDSESSLEIVCRTSAARGSRAAQLRS
jgi:hypothetical protein